MIFVSDLFLIYGLIFISLHMLEKPSAFDPRGQAMLTLTGKI